MRHRTVARQRRAQAAATGLALVGLAVAACGGGPTSPLTPADVVGTYALQSINGQALPAPYGQGTATVYDTLSVAPDSTWTERFGGGLLGSSVVTYYRTSTGQWTLGATGRQLLIMQPVGHAVIDTSTYTVVNRGASLRFDAGPVGPANPGGGLWVYNRVR